MWDFYVPINNTHNILHLLKPASISLRLHSLLQIAINPVKFYPMASCTSSLFSRRLCSLLPSIPPLQVWVLEMQWLEGEKVFWVDM